MKKNVLLVGSGPSSYASCLRLLNSSFEIFLVDGRNLEGLKYAECIYDKLNNVDDSRVKKFSKNNLDMKFYPEENIYPKPSLIFGGYSNIWGGAVSLISEGHKDKWGESFNGIQNSYKHLISQLNIHSNSKKFVKMTENRLPISEREVKLLKKFSNKSNQNFFADYSAIALDRAADETLCCKCGEYAWSCNTNASWSSTNRFEELISEGKVNYIKNAIVNKVSENNQDNFVNVEILTDEKIEIKEFNKVMIGAGAIGTSKIMLNSIQDLKQIEIKSNDLVTIPYLNFSKSSKKYHTFSDIFFQFKNNNKDFFGQLYGISDNLFKMSSNAVPIATKLKYLIKPILKFSGGIFLYFDEMISSTLIIKEGNIQLSGRKSNKKDSFSALFILFIHLLKLGILSFPFLGTKKKYGNSNHYGSQFPLSNSKKLNSTDLVGRLKNFDNVHIIDSSVLPYLEPGPITLTVMANSFRITDMVCNEA